MNNIPKYGPGAPFLDEEEKELVTDFEAAVEDGVISPQSTVEQEAIRDEWKGVLENTLKRKAVTLRLQDRDIKRVKAIAREMDMPYQTYLVFVVHRIANGKIIVR